MTERAEHTAGPPFDELRRCIETLKPYIGRPIGAPGSFARIEQEDRKYAYERANQIVASLAARYSITKRTEV
jgi:hypothetical protein